MNNVQTNLMSVAPAPSTTAKANAAEAVRPADRTGAATDRGAKSPSFDRALAKLKTLKRNLAEATETMEKDPLVASFAASQQAKPTDSGGSTAKTVEIVENAEEGASVKAVADKGVPSEASSLIRLAVFAEEQQELSAVPVSADGVQDTQELPLQEESSAAEMKPAPAQDESGAVAKAQPQNKTADMSSLAALLPRSEQPDRSLLQALRGRILPQMTQAIQLPQVTADDGFSEAIEASQKTDMNLAASVKDDAVLSDALLRTLAQQPVVSAAAGTAQESRPTTLLPSGEAAPSLSTASFDAGIAVSPSAGTTAEGRDLTQTSSQEDFAELFSEQQTLQDKKAEGSKTLSQSAATQPEGAARTKANDAMQLFTEAAQSSQGGQEASHASQTNPGVTVQTALQETVETQPTAPAAPQKDYEVAKQIVEQARLLRLPEETQMVIRLKPEHLGELTLKVSVAASGTVNAAFHTDNASVRAIIETSMIQLKHELQAQGLKVDNVGVYAGLGDSSLMNQQDANAHYAQHGGQGSSRGHDARQALASFEEEQQALAASAQQGVLAQDGVDYRI